MAIVAWLTLKHFLCLAVQVRIKCFSQYCLLFICFVLFCCCCFLKRKDKIFSLFFLKHWCSTFFIFPINETYYQTWSFLYQSANIRQYELRLERESFVLIYLEIKADYRSEQFILNFTKGIYERLSFSLFKTNSFQ